ncbi:amino acid adenylation domain-containing protein [Streptomyces sp. ISL-86]|uniref:non-ribosomal peptide synthetase n=1 Tax=Streptomyces sp. ISL-86 TaxID=2819187 RepID=UPI001BECB219|nr:amino acid adenylation domain-containing protein [Streptomyces sp. ISL-86]MBT2454427.1 amino acid adenylation domain-containing protein [Streptomyces sp. ISL-86]
MKGAPPAPSRTRLPRRPAPPASAPAAPTTPPAATPSTATAGATGGTTGDTPATATAGATAGATADAVAGTEATATTDTTAGTTRTRTHDVAVPAETAAGLYRTAADLGVPLAALLGAAHARVLATVAAVRELRTGLADGRATRELRLTVAPSTWAELASATAAALADATLPEHAPAHAAPAFGVPTGSTGPEASGTRPEANGTGPEASGTRPEASGTRPEANGTRPEVVLGLSEAAEGPLGDGEILHVTWAGDGTALRVAYDPRAVDTAYAQRLAGYHLTALRLLSEDPHARHDRQSLLSAQEVETQLYGLAGPRTELPDAVLTDLFEARVRRHPDAVAAEHGPRSWTYRRLDARANRIAHALLAAGSGPQDVVAVVMDRSLDWIAAALGVLKAGAVYLPMGPDLPVDRISAQLAAAGAAFVLTDPDAEVLVHKAAGEGTPVLSVPEIHAAALPDTPPGVRVAPGQAAYVYFTSGSTGTPKGAVCEHAGLLNHLLAKARDMGLADGGDEDSREVVAQTAPQSFDISLWQFAAPLLTGGTTRIIATDVLLDVAGFLDEITEAGVTVAQTVPAYLEVLVRHLERRPRELGALRTVSVTGEVLSPGLVRRWFALCPTISLVNAYGATEVCDDTMHEVLHTAPAPGHPVTLGRSLPNVNTYVLDENLALVPLGSPGEIAFSGVCVGRGYLNDEERTQQAFVPDPFRAGARMYRTGDFGRWLPDGRMEYLGRHDEQVKIRGFRIELGEIENKLLAVPGIREAAVVIVGDAGIHRHLVAFYTADGAETSVEQARGHLAAVLPDYMVPSYLHRLGRLPRTANGKADKKALAELAGTLGHGGAGHTGPATATERRLAMLWAEVLGVPLERIGRHDSFFALGASSLAAVRVIVRLDRALSLKELVAHPVLADLAGVLDDRRRGEPREGAPPLLHPLLPVRTPHHTLVCLPYAGGSALNFRALAAELEGDGIAVLGAELPGHDFAAEDEPLEDVAVIAERARDEILARVSTPVLLWGHCSGAAVALETARLLQEAGRPVARVFIGGQLLHGPDALRAELAEVGGAGRETLLGRLRADNAYVELDAFTPERAAAVDRAYRHDVITANRHLLRVHADPAAHRIDAPVEVVVARDDAWTAAAAHGHQAWRMVSGHVTLHELEEGGHYFAGTRAAETADVVRRMTV